MASSGKTNSNIAHLTPADVAKWPHPNYVDPETIPWLPVYSSVWFAAATILFGMRCWLRLRGHAGRLGLDDVRDTNTITCIAYGHDILTILNRQYYFPAGSPG
jgi:hypothetical protein